MILDLYTYRQKQQLKNLKKKLLTTNDISIINTILSYCKKNKEGGVSIPKICNELNLNYTTVRYSIQKLKNLGVIYESNKNTHPTEYEVKKFIAVLLSPHTVLYILHDIALPVYYPEYTILPLDPSCEYPFLLDLKDIPDELFNVLVKIKENVILAEKILSRDNKSK